MYDNEYFPEKVIVSGVAPRLYPADQLFIHTNIIQPIDLNDKTVDLLKVVNVRGEQNRSTYEAFSHPAYQPVQKGKQITMIHVYIKSELGDLVPFESGTLMMTLHFRKQRYRR